MGQITEVSAAAPERTVLLGRVSGADVHDLFERFPKLGIEDRVDDRVHKTVHVAQPRGQYKDGDARLAVHVQLHAHRVHDVAREERHPAYQEDAWTEIDREIIGCFK